MTPRCLLYINSKDNKSQIENSKSHIGLNGVIITSVKKVISFDLDGTLVNAAYGDSVWNIGIPEEFSKKYSVSLKEAKEQIVRQYNSVGDASILWYEIDYWLDKFELSVSAHDLLDRYESHIEVLPYVKEVLEKLKDSHKLVIASNAARIFVEKELHHTDLARFFEHVVSATTDYGMVKKEIEFYKKLCKTLDVSSSEIVHVGDHPVFDYEAPRSLGIEAYCFRSNGSRHLGDVSTHDNGNVIYDFREILDHL